MTELEKTQMKNIWTLSKNILLLLGTLIILFLAVRSCKVEQQLASNTTMNKALKDSLKTWRDKEGNFKAKITVLEDSNINYFTNLSTADSTIIKLQSLVSQYKKQLKNKGSATTFTTDAEINILEPTIVHRDTANPCEPVYTRDFKIMGTGKYKNTKWIWGFMKATKDSTQIGLRFHEEIDVVIGEEKTGFLGLGKTKPFAEVTLHNPFNSVSTLKSFNVISPKAKRIGIGPTLSYGIGSGFIPQVFVGVGVQYSFIRL